MEEGTANIFNKRARLFSSLFSNEKLQDVPPQQITVLRLQKEEL